MRPHGELNSGRTDQLATLFDAAVMRVWMRCVGWQVKAGDASAGPEAVRQYTEGLILLQEAIDSGNYNEKVCESLNKKAKGVRKRIKDLKVPGSEASLDLQCACIQAYLSYS
eukprot:COSAG02_NODE_12658_length_1513_cov_2.401697_3_plen_111_part_01